MATAERNIWRPTEERWAVEAIHRWREFRRICRSVEGDVAEIGSTRECVNFSRRKELREDLVSDVLGVERVAISLPFQYPSPYFHPWGAFLV